MLFVLKLRRNTILVQLDEATGVCEYAAPCRYMPQRPTSHKGGGGGGSAPATSTTVDSTASFRALIREAQADGRVAATMTEAEALVLQRRIVSDLMQLGVAAERAVTRVNELLVGPSAPQPRRSERERLRRGRPTPPS